MAKRTRESLPPMEVLIPVWNHQGGLERAVASVATSFRFSGIRPSITIVDDGSLEPVSRSMFSPLVDLEGIRVLRQSHLGLSHALNTGVRRCRSPWLVRVDSDDLVTHDFIGSLAEVCRDDVTLAFGSYIIDWTARDSKIYQPEATDVFSLLGAGVALNIATLREVGGWRDLFWEEFDLYLRMQACGAWVPATAKGAIYRYKRGPNSMTAHRFNVAEGWRQLIEYWPQLADLPKVPQPGWLNYPTDGAGESA